MKIVGTGTITGVLGESERRRIEDIQNENRKFVTIPRRFCIQHSNKITIFKYFKLSSNFLNVIIGNLLHSLPLKHLN